MIDRASIFEELRVKEALHIHLTPEEQRLNQDVGLTAGFPLTSLAGQTLTLSGESLVRYSATDCSG